jgi:branched-chain amino acid transport system ATP-binding protein
MNGAKPILSLRNVQVAYGKAQALHDVSLEIGKGEVVALIGANGAGKTTTLRSISGLLKPSSGEIEFRGKLITRNSPDAIVRAGIAQCPEERHVWPEMTVEENLRLGGYLVRDKAELARRAESVFARFARLRERARQLAGTLSGGEQQMLAIGRALMANPRILLMDEPSEGLAPQIVAEVMATIRRLKEQGLSIVLVEQNAKLVFDVADDIVILNSGHVVIDAPTAELKAANIDLHQHLGIY